MGMVTEDVSIVTEGVTPFVGPVTFTIPLRQPFSIRMFSPTNPFEPSRPVIINTWGINFAGVIQQGNTLLNGQSQPVEPFSSTAPS